MRKREGKENENWKQKKCDKTCNKQGCARRCLFGREKLCKRARALPTKRLTASRQYGEEFFLLGNEDE